MQVPAKDEVNEWFADVHVRWTWKDWRWNGRSLVSRHYYGIRMERLRKITKTLSQDIP